MAKIDVKCPRCKEVNVVKHGKTPTRIQRYRCLNENCNKNTFLMDYTHNGCKPGINEKIVNMAANASGIRDTARVLKISQDKVMDVLKKQVHS
jgi:transposase-like protein